MPIFAINRAFWKVIAEETEIAVANGDTWKLYQMQKNVNRRPIEGSEALLDQDGIDFPYQESFEEGYTKNLRGEVY